MPIDCYGNYFDYVCSCMECPTCEGEGKIFGVIASWKCEDCNGTGIDPEYMGCDCEVD